MKADHGTCETCGIPIKRKDTGRPRLYCSARCKEKAKRKAARERSRNAVAELATLQVDEGFSGGDVTCHVCGRATATVGVPEPLICAACSRGTAP